VGESAKDAVVRNVQAAVPADRWSAASRVLQGIEVLNNYEMAVNCCVSRWSVGGSNRSPPLRIQ